MHLQSYSQQRGYYRFIFGGRHTYLLQNTRIDYANKRFAS